MRTLFIAALVAFIALSAATVANASDHDRDRGRDRDRDRHHERDDDHRGRGDDRARSLGAIDPLYAKECGACHVAYPPALMPAASWRSVMASLDRHFGDNAELEPKVRAELEAWILSRAAPDRGAARSPRMTEQPWFLDEHDDEDVPRDFAARPEIRTMANCTACHPGAESWDFDDDRVKIPAR